MVFVTYALPHNYPRKLWVRPELIRHGSIEDLTKGGSGPTQEGAGQAADGDMGADAPPGQVDRSPRP